MQSSPEAAPIKPLPLPEKKPRLELMKTLPAIRPVEAPLLEPVDEDTLPKLEKPRATPPPLPIRKKVEGPKSLKSVEGFQNVDVSITNNPDRIFADPENGLFGVMDEAASHAMRLIISSRFQRKIAELQPISEDELLEKIVKHQLQRFGISTDKEHDGKNIQEQVYATKAVHSAFEGHPDMARKTLALLYAVDEAIQKAQQEGEEIGSSIIGFTEKDPDFQTSLPEVTESDHMLGISVKTGENMHAFKRRANGEVVPVTGQHGSKTIPELSARSLVSGDQLEFAVGEDEELAVIVRAH